MGDAMIRQAISFTALPEVNRAEQFVDDAFFISQ